MANDSIKIRPSDNLKEYIQSSMKDCQDAPEAIRAVVEIDESLRKRGGKAALSTIENRVLDPLFTLQDVRWLHTYVQKLRENGDQPTTMHLHTMLEGCDIVLPEPPVVERNPVLEARVQRLKKEQEAREYRAMTRNVDNTRIHHPEETIAYQMKMMNTHLIAVLQFIVSVGAGFAFGFLGIELMVGSLEFGFRLLLGVACALTIALAEIYFLAKKLSEDYDEAPPVPYQPVTGVMPTSLSKQHRD